MVEPLYQVKIHCSYCDMDFSTSRIRTSFKKSIGADTDFCVRYRDHNPDFYLVRVCPYCGYASTENFSTGFADAHKQEFKSKVNDHWDLRDYGMERSWEEALQTYQLALVCAQIKREKMRVVAGLLHHIAWLHRIKGNEEQENRFLRFALDAYVEVFENEDSNSAKLMYMMGELHRRLLNYSEAVRWFSRVVNDKRIMDSAMIQASRQQWMQVREDMKTAEAVKESDEINEAPV